MAEPMLSAAEVAAIAEVAATALDVQRNADGGACAAITCLIHDDVPALAAQDARWRALVGEIVTCALPYLGAWEAVASVEADRGEHEALAHRWLAAIRQAQAALDGAAAEGDAK